MTAQMTHMTQTTQITQMTETTQTTTALDGGPGRHTHGGGLNACGPHHERPRR